MYNKVTSADIEFIKNTTAPDRVFTGEEISVDYSHDELCGATGHLPEVLVKVISAEEISAILKYANDHLIPVVARGSGTGLVGASVALNGGIMIETTAMNKIIELDEENLTITVQPGSLLMDVQTYCNEHDFMYPPDPGEKYATIGGNISTNAGGMRAVKYGVTRDYVRAVTVVLPSGETVQLGSKVVKNSSGYALKDLIIGSEGTLGIITEAILKIVPLPKISTSLLVPFPSITAAIEAVPVLIKSRASLTAIEFTEQAMILFSEEYLGKSFPDKKSPAYLILTIDGNEQTVIDAEIENVAELCLSAGASDVLIVDTDERKDSVWKARGSFLDAIKGSTTELDECDVVIPRNKVAEFIQYTHELSKELNVRIPSFGHAGDGNVHIYVCRDELSQDNWEEVLEKSFDKLYEKARALDGLVSGEHGIGFAKKPYLYQYGDTQLELMRGIKKAFDPNNILNPGKVF